MDNSEVHQHIDALANEEQELRDTPNKTPQILDRIREIERELDQYWDLLRQRRARIEFGQDPNDTHLRPQSEVENYKS